MSGYLGHLGPAGLLVHIVLDVVIIVLLARAAWLMLRRIRDDMEKPQ